MTKRKRTAHRAPKLFSFYIKRRNEAYSAVREDHRIRAERVDVSPSGMILFYRGNAITNMVSQALVSSVTRRALADDDRVDVV